MENFNRNIEELVGALDVKSKDNLVRNLKKNYQKNIQYIINQPVFLQQNEGDKKRGGQNKLDFMLTEKTFELLKNSYNLRNRYLTQITDNTPVINSINMCIENQTIGFIANSFKNIFNVKRQYKIGNYNVDLYFIDHKLVVECDENNHYDRNQTDELIRENFIKSFSNKIIRFNPNAKNFDLSNVLQEIHSIIYKQVIYPK
jgi:very-short-patch-repair endonuclease